MVTQKTIAQKLGISPSLVSRALSGTAGDIGASPETVKRICETAKQLGYAPNAAAQALRGAKSKTIGVVIKDFHDPFLGEMIGSLQRQAEKDGCSLLVTGLDTVRHRHLKDAASLLRYRPDALILCGSDICGAWLKPFLAAAIPVIQIGSDADYPGVARVENDERAGLRLLLDFLLGAGHRRIGFIGSDSGPHRRRRRLLEAELRERGIVRAVFVAVPDGDGVGRRAMARLLRKTGVRRPSVVIAADDATAQEALRAIHEAHLAVPDDLSLTGIDDIPGAALMIPALTTVRAPVRRLAEAAFELLAGAGEGRRQLEPELVIRESCAEAP